MTGAHDNQPKSGLLGAEILVYYAVDHEDVLGIYITRASSVLKFRTSHTRSALVLTLAGIMSVDAHINTYIQLRAWLRALRLKVVLILLVTNGPSFMVHS